MEEININNDDYLNDFIIIKKKFDNIINEPLFKNYIKIIQEQKNNVKIIIIAVD